MKVFHVDKLSKIYVKEIVENMKMKERVIIIYQIIVKHVQDAVQLYKKYKPHSKKCTKEQQAWQGGQLNVIILLVRIVKSNFAGHV